MASLALIWIFLQVFVNTAPSDPSIFSMVHSLKADMLRKHQEAKMQKNLGLIIVLLMAATTLSGCAAVAVGAAGAVVADKVVEDRNGGDGLF